MERAERRMKGSAKEQITFLLKAKMSIRSLKKQYLTKANIEKGLHLCECVLSESRRCESLWGSGCLTNHSADSSKFFWPLCVFLLCVCVRESERERETSVGLWFYV